MKALNSLSESFLAAHPIEAAQILEGVEEKPLARFLSRLEPDAAARLVEHFDPEIAAACLGKMTIGAAASILNGVGSHARVIVLRQMPERRRENVITAMEDEAAEQARRLLRYPGESVASLMDTQVLTLPEDMRTDEALRRIRRVRRQLGDIIHVVDRKHRLVGLTSLHELIVAPPDQQVSESAVKECPRVLAGTPQRDLVAHPLWAEHNSVAVVDGDDVILGVVDHRTIAKAGEQLRSRGSRDEGLDAVLALGELYWMGLTGILDGLAGRTLVMSNREGLEDGKSDEG
jgi:magnesium transporter